MSKLFAEFQSRVRNLLKSMPEGDADASAAGGEKSDSVLVDPPHDPDAIPTDSRVDGSQPTTESMDAASQESQAGQQAAAAAAPDAGAGDGAGGAGDAGSGDGDGDEGFDAHGNHDLSDDEMRGMQKAYGNKTGQAEPEELLKGGVDLQGLLESLLQVAEDQDARFVAMQAEISDLRAEVNRLQIGVKAGERSMSKALAELGVADLSAIPEPPAAPKPRAVVKHIPEPPKPPTPSGDMATRLFNEVRSGRLPLEDAKQQLRDSRLPN